MNYPAAGLRGIWNTEYSSQNFFEDILIPLLDSYPEAELRGILLIKRLCNNLKVSMFCPVHALV
jgi:hypothetical protein